MEEINMSQSHAVVSELDYWPGAEPEGASRRVYLGIMQDLEERRMAPGQRLVETELAARFGVGRNAVREAIQRLAVRGVVDLSRNRSSAIRQLDRAETMEVLDVASTMTALVATAAARRYEEALHAAIIDRAMVELAAINAMSEPHMFSRARRHFYRALLSIGGNRELQRLFPAIGMHIIYSQFQSPRLQDIRLADYRKIHGTVISCDAAAAAVAGQEHVENVRAMISDLIGR
jgi:DNA-binding GntR family transcriptional regulator